MSEPLVSIIIPTRNRSHLLKPRLELLVKNTPEVAEGVAEVVVAYDSDDHETDETIRNYFPNFLLNVCKPLELPCNKWNYAARDTSSKWLVTMSDDSEPEKNWLSHALCMVSFGFIALPDGVTGSRNDSFTPLYMATRTWLKYFNGGVLVIPKYKSWYADIETAERAHRSNTYVLGKHSVVKQLHADFGSAPNDEIYRLGITRRHEDLKTYESRKLAGFPNDFEGVL